MKGSFRNSYNVFILFCFLVLVLTSVASTKSDGLHTRAPALSLQSGPVYQISIFNLHVFVSFCYVGV